MKKNIGVSLFIVILLTLITITAFAGGNARRPAIVSSASRVVQLQRTDPGWEGTWYWYVGSTGNATNLTGVTALGLLEAYNDTNDEAYRDAALDAADFIMTHLGSGATGTKYHVRTTAPDVVFLHRLSQVTGDPSYSIRATLEWNNIKATYPSAASLDALFHTINRRSAWDIAFFLEAAYLSADSIWANDAAAILANTSDTFYYGPDTWWYALNVAGAIRVLVNYGYASQFNVEIGVLLTSLVGLIDETDGVGGYVQDTAYAILAFNSVGGAAHKYANDLGRWLASNQESNGGWIEGGDEYPEIDGEALRALSSTIGSDVTFDGFNFGSGQGMNSSWRRSLNSEAIPYGD